MISNISKVVSVTGLDLIIKLPSFGLFASSQVAIKSLVDCELASTLLIYIVNAVPGEVVPFCNVILNENLPAPGSTLDVELLKR